MLKHKVARGAANLALFQLAGKLLDLVIVVVLARLLVPEDFGLVALATSTMLIAATVTELPVIDVLVQRESLDKRDVDSAFTLNLLRGLTVFSFLALASFPVALIYNDPNLIPVLWCLGLAPLFKSLESPALVYPLREVNYGPTAKILLIGKIVGAIASLCLATAWPSYWALVAGVVVAALTSALWSYKLCPYRPKIRFAGIQSIIGFAGWITASRIIFALNQQGDRFFVGYILGKGQLGQYAMGSDISSMATYSLAGPILRPIFAGMSRIQTDLIRLRSAYLRSQQSLMMIVLPFGFGLAAIASDLVPLLLGSGWDSAVPVIQWLAPVIALQMLSVPVQAVAMARGTPKALALREGVSLILRLPATLIGAWFFGLTGAVIARALSGGLIILFNLFIVKSLIQMSVLTQLKNAWRSGISVLVMVAGIAFLKALFPAPPEQYIQILRIVGFVLAGLVTYIGVHLTLWYLCKKPDGAETFLLEILNKKKRVG